MKPNILLNFYFTVRKTCGRRRRSAAKLTIASQRENDSGEGLVHISPPPRLKGYHYLVSSGAAGVPAMDTPTSKTSSVNTPQVG